MTRRQLQAFKQRLVEQLTALFTDVQSETRRAMMRQLFDEDEPRDEGDESLRAQLRDARMSLAENEARRAQQIEAALARIRDGIFGICVDCGRAIEIERLKAVPWAARCVEDQSAFERERQPRPPSL